MASADYINTASAYQPRPGDIVSRCGLLCNTCSAYIAGACPRCPGPATGDSDILVCAQLHGTSCLDCQADSCYPSEAYVWRRKTKNAVAKRFFRLTRQGGAAAAGAAGAAPAGRAAGACGNGGCGGCGTGGGSTGGCGGGRLQNGGWPAAPAAETPAARETR